MAGHARYTSLFISSHSLQNNEKWPSSAQRRRLICGISM